MNGDGVGYGGEGLGGGRGCGEGGWCCSRLSLRDVGHEDLEHLVPFLPPLPTLGLLPLPNLVLVHLVHLLPFPLLESHARQLLFLDRGEARRVVRFRLLGLRLQVSGKVVHENCEICRKESVGSWRQRGRRGRTVLDEEDDFFWEEQEGQP